MCVTTAMAKLANTTLYAAEVLRGGEEVVHVAGYQNEVQDLARPHRGKTGNAMILPFPAVPGSMTQANVIPTELCPNILSDMAEVVRHLIMGQLCRSFGFGEGAGGEVEVFETGIYTVVLARDARAIPGALHLVAPEKRPPLNRALFGAYARWYPEWTIALCCFNNRHAALATPMLWWYKPASPEQLFAPALDCHTGAIPDVDAQVVVDHAVALGSYLMGGGAPVTFRDPIPASVAPYLCQRITGGQFQGKLPNGDFVCRAEDVRAGKCVPERVKPPGA